MRGRRTRSATAVLVASLLFAAGCGDDGSGDSADPGGSTTAAPGGESSTEGGECTQDRVGGTLTIGEYAPTIGLDPVVGSGSGLSSGRVGAVAGYALYDALLILDEETGEFSPHVAESIEANDDHTVWTLTLRPDLTFDNGDPFDAEAVVASIQRHTAEGSNSTIRRGLELVSEYRVVDDLTIEFHLTDPWGYFPMVLAGTAGMITNPTVVEARGEDFNLSPAGGGIGPYEVARFQPGEELVLQAKDDYWDGPVCIEEVTFEHHQGAGLTYEALKGAQIDVGFLQEADVIATAKADGYDGLQWILQSGALFMMNTGVGELDPPTADVRVRQAVAHAIDPEVLNQRRFSGEGLPTSALTYPEAVFAPDVPGPEYDPDQARQLVEAVKAETGWDGSIRVVCSEDTGEAALAAQALLGAVGMQVEPTITDTAGLIRAVIIEKNYDLACWGSSFTIGDAWFALSSYTSDSPTSYTGIADAQLDDALAQLRAAANVDQIRDGLAAVQTRWNEVMPAAAYGALETYVAYDTDVHGLVQTTREGFLLHDAYLG